MTSNAVLRHRDVGLLSIEAVEAPIEVTSAWIDEQLAEVYTRTGLKPGTLQSLAGIESRRWWPEDVTFDEAAASAGRKAIEAAGIDPSQVGLLISTSVCKHHLEPSVASAVHHHLDLPPSCMNFDVGNACLGFVNGMQIAAAMIDSGTIDYALVVDGEGSRYTQETTIARLQATATEPAHLSTNSHRSRWAQAPQLQCCAVLPSTQSPTVLGGIARAATQHHQLCVGDLDRMTTDTRGLLVAGLELSEAAWKEAGRHFDWEVGMDWYIIHQISQVHTTMMCAQLGLDLAKVPLTFPYYGNVGPAAIPITLATVADQIQPGQRVLCMGMGSGLNASIAEIVW